MHPVLEDGEIEESYVHPLHQIYTNQIGMLMPVDPDFYLDQYTNGYISIGSDTVKSKSLGSKAKLVYECYTGKSVQNGFVYHVNANSLDYTPENLALSTTGTGEGYKTYRKLLELIENRTVSYMLVRSEKLLKNNQDPVRYWELAQVPTKLFKNWKVLFERRFALNLQR